MRLARNIRTDRLHLRPLTVGDIGFFIRLVGDPEVRRYLGGPVPWMRRLWRFRDYVVGQADGTIWAVSRDTAGGAIGLVELGPHKDGTDHEISYQFDPRSWGHGFAREAVGAVLEQALRADGLTRVIAETQSANRASCRLLEHVGMSEVERVHRFGAEQVIYAVQASKGR